MTLAHNPQAQAIQALRDEIRKHDQAYYVHDAPLISDAEYDALMQVPRNYNSNFANPLHLMVCRNKLVLRYG